MAACKTCNGTGLPHYAVDPRWNQCGDCYGTGNVPDEQPPRCVKCGKPAEFRAKGGQVVCAECGVDHTVRPLTPDERAVPKCCATGCDRDATTRIDGPNQYDTTHACERHRRDLEADGSVTVFLNPNTTRGNESQTPPACTVCHGRGVEPAVAVVMGQPMGWNRRCDGCGGSGNAPDGPPQRPGCSVGGCGLPAAFVSAGGVHACYEHAVGRTVFPVYAPGTPAQVRAEAGLWPPQEEQPIESAVLPRARIRSDLVGTGIDTTAATDKVLRAVAKRAEELAEADAPLVVGADGVKEPPVVGFARDVLGVEPTPEQVRVVELADPDRCRTCFGKGSVEIVVPGTELQDHVTCTVCGGTGKVAGGGPVPDFASFFGAPKSYRWEAGNPPQGSVQAMKRDPVIADLLATVGSPPELTVAPPPLPHLCGWSGCAKPAVNAPGGGIPHCEAHRAVVTNAAAFTAAQERELAAAGVTEPVKYQPIEGKPDPTTSAAMHEYFDRHIERLIVGQSIKDERREAVLWVNERAVLTALTVRGRTPESVIRLMYPDDIPQDARVVQVRHEWERRQFAFLLTHPSFDPVPDGGYAPPVGTKHGPMMEVVRTLPPAKYPDADCYRGNHGWVVCNDAAVLGTFPDKELADLFLLAVRGH